MAYVPRQPDLIILDGIEVMLLPELSSNFAFINKDDISVRITEELIDHLKSMGYQVKKPEFGPQAGGSSLFGTDFINLIKSFTDVMGLFPLVLGISKAIKNVFFLRAHHVSNSVRPIVVIELRFTSPNQLQEHDNGVFMYATRICAALLSASNESLNFLGSKYPNILFKQRVVMSLDYYRCVVQYDFNSTIFPNWTNYRLIKLFKIISLKNNTNTSFIVGRFVVTRTDRKIIEEFAYSGSYNPKRSKKYYFLILGRIFPNDYLAKLRSNNHNNDTI